MHKSIKNSYASASAACDGQRIYYPWVADDAAAYHAMIQTASAAGVDTTMDDPLIQLMKAAAAGGAIRKDKQANKLETIITEKASSVQHG